MKVELRVIVETFDDTPVREIIDDVVTLLEDDFPNVEVRLVEGKE